MLLLTASAWLLLQWAMCRLDGPEGPFARALGADRKGVASSVLYAVGIGSAFVAPVAAEILHAAVAAIWLVPDRRVAHVAAHRADMGRHD